MDEKRREELGFGLVDTWVDGFGVRVACRWVGGWVGGCVGDGKALLLYVPELVPKLLAGRQNLVAVQVLDMCMGMYGGWVGICPSVSLPHPSEPSVNPPTHPPGCSGGAGA